MIDERYSESADCEIVRPTPKRLLPPAGLTIKLTCRAACNGVVWRENQYGGPVRCSARFGGVPSTSDREPQL